MSGVGVCLWGVGWVGSRLGVCGFGYDLICRVGADVDFLGFGC